MTRDYFYLCFACGAVAPADEYEALVYDDDHDDFVPAPPGASDPTLRCPACAHDHTDDDSNPGVADGTREQVDAERRLAADDWRDAWADRWGVT